MDADGPRPEPRVGGAIPGDDPPSLARAEDRAATVDGGENRRGLEVVVTYVVGSHLVVPEETARRSVEHDERIRVERGPGKDAAVRVRARPTPRAGIRDARVHVAVLVDAHRIPGAAAAAGGGMRPRQLDRLEAPDDPARLGRQRIERATASRREALRADVHPAAVDDRRDRDELLERAGKPVATRGVCRSSRRARRPSCRLRRRAANRRPRRRSGRRSAPSGVLPEQRAAPNVECVDTRCGVLQIHRRSRG